MMLLKQTTLRGIKEGSITLAFRRWKRPTVKAGGTLLTSIGQLQVQALDTVDLSTITTSEARAAGFPDLATLRSELSKRSTGDVYRIRLGFSGPDPRVALRDDVPDDEALEALLTRLERLDAHSRSGPWTHAYLGLIGQRPAQLAADLARECGLDTAAFKVRVRRLKGLGLTESLPVGYRLSPRGRLVLEHSSPTPADAS